MKIIGDTKMKIEEQDFTVDEVLEMLVRSVSRIFDERQIDYSMALLKERGFSFDVLPNHQRKRGMFSTEQQEVVAAINHLRQNGIITTRKIID